MDSMRVWDDEIPVGMVDRSPQAVIDAQNVELIDLRIAWQRALVQRDSWTAIAFGVGVLLGWLASYVR